MAVPFRRTSKAKKNARRSHLHLATANRSLCKNCGSTIASHRVCMHCGFYRGQKVIEVEK